MASWLNISLADDVPTLDGGLRNASVYFNENNES
jgi:hypothetical protein